MRSFIQLACAAVVAVLSIATVAAAAAPSAPEIEPTSVGAGLGVLAAGILMMRSRRGNRK
jgi:hypothetical protein